MPGLTIPDTTLPDQSGVGAAVVARRIRPEHAVAAYVLFLALPQNNVLIGGGGAITPARILAGVCLLWWLIARAHRGFGLLSKPNPIRRALLVALVLFTAADAIAFGYGVADERLAAADRAALLFALACAVALLACDALTSVRAIQMVCAAAVLGFTASAASAVVAFTTGFNARVLTVLPGLTAQGLGDIDLARGGLQRALGFANHPIELAATSIAILPLALHLTKHGRYRAWWWLCVAILVGGALVSISRTGLVGIAIVVVLLLPRLGFGRWLLSMGCIGLFGLLANSIEPKLSTVLVNTVLGSSKDSSIWSRLTKYDYVWSRFIERPLGGQGLGTYLTPAQPFLDNQYLLTTVESGILGLAAFIAILVVPLWSMLRVWRAKTVFPTPVGRDLTWALGTAILVCAVSFGTYDGLAFPQFSGVTLLLIGLAAGTLAAAKEARTS